MLAAARYGGSGSVVVAVVLWLVSESPPFIITVLCGFGAVCETEVGGTDDIDPKGRA